MNTATQIEAPVRRLTLAAWGIGAVAAQVVLLGAAAVLFPALAHTTGLPVRTLLPMHWPVILAGLVFGWRGGAIVGALAPCSSFLVSGMPLPMMLPAMTVELAAYGAIAGFTRQNLKLNGFACAALALLGGRLLFVAIAVATGVTASGFVAYLERAMLPGLAAAVAQMVALPLLAAWWVRNAAPRP